MPFHFAAFSTESTPWEGLSPVDNAGNISLKCDSPKDCYLRKVSLCLQLSSLPCLTYKGRNLVKIIGVTSKQHQVIVPVASSARRSSGQEIRPPLRSHHMLSLVQSAKTQHCLLDFNTPKISVFTIEEVQIMIDCAWAGFSAIYIYDKKMYLQIRKLNIRLNSILVLTVLNILTIIKYFVLWLRSERMRYTLRRLFTNGADWWGSSSFTTSRVDFLDRWFPLFVLSIFFHTAEILAAHKGSWGPGFSVRPEWVSFNLVNIIIKGTFSVPGGKKICCSHAFLSL